MIEYQLKDEDGNTFDLNGSSVTVALKNSVTQGEDSFDYDNKIIDRSYLDGSVVIGSKRLIARKYVMQITHVNNDSSAYRAIINELLYWLSKTVYIVDVTNSLELSVVISEINISYDEGALKLSSDDSFSFIALTPYWSDIAYNELTGTALATTIKTVPISNSGFLKAFPVITLTATVATSDVQIYIDGLNAGIQIQDNLFGTVGYLSMVIDCETGLVTLGELNINNSIAQGTGFFYISPGSDQINILSNQQITYSIKWKKRYFV